MLKLLIFLLGLAGGAGGVTAWLLSEPSTPEDTVPTTPGDLQVRLNDLKIRWNEALAEGKRAGQEAEERLRGELDAYRKGATQASMR
jgi:hypothetical protein